MSITSDCQDRRWNVSLTDGNQICKICFEVSFCFDAILSRTLLDSFKKTCSNSVSILDMNSSKFASVIYNSFPRLYRAISIRTKGFQSLAKFTKSSDVNQVHVFEQKTGLSTKDINPLRRAIQRFRGAINPLWRAVKLLRRALRRAIRPLWRKQNKPLRRAVKLLRRAIKPLRRVFGGSSEGYLTSS